MNRFCAPERRILRKVDAGRFQALYGQSLPAPIGERLKRTRVALQMTQVEICRRAGITPSAWSNWEKGAKNRPDLNEALKLVAEFRLTLDWIYLGDPSGLPRDLSLSLVLTQAEPPRRPAAKKGRQSSAFSQKARKAARVLVFSAGISATATFCLVPHSTASEEGFYIRRDLQVAQAAPNRQMIARTDQSLTPY